MLAVLAGVVFVQGVPGVAWGQAAGGGAPDQRLQQEQKNRYRGGVGSPDEVFNNMKKLYKAIMVEGKDDSKVDKWYSPHLRDIKIDGPPREDEVDMRAKAGRRPAVDACFESFIDPLLGVAAEAACPAPKCKWHEDTKKGTVKGSPQSHRPLKCCPYPMGTLKGDTFSGYKNLRFDSNFKACCVKKDEWNWSSEAIACDHPDGSGWAGLFEYYFPTEALGWENDRTTTMIVDKANIEKCVEKTGKLMEDDKRVDWVTGAIKRNIDQANKLGGGGSPANEAEIRSKVQQVIKEVRPQKQDNRFADSLQGEGLTLRPNFATLDREHREKLAERFCMHKEQFMKLMDAKEDGLQKNGGDGSWKSLDKNIPVWSNYCPEGVELMTNPKMSALDNVDKTPTEFKKGMAIWEKDPMFCQRMNARDNENLKNPSIDTSKIGEVIKKSGQQVYDEKYDEKAVGYTCRKGGKLNGSLVPVELYRHAAVERRTAISDHALGFLIAAGLAKEQKMLEGKKSYYKRFEPQPYSNSNKVEFDYQTFVGKQFKGKDGRGEKNELGTPCPNIQGKNFEGKTKSDQLYISDFTNKSFTQDPINESDGKGEFNRYVQGWAKDSKEDQKEITTRGLDEKSSNYAAPFRIFATCPKGYVRWRPPEDVHNAGLFKNLDLYCREENFGGPHRTDNRK